MALKRGNTMHDTDFAIIGAGIAGLTAAATAARQGLRVRVVERLGAGGQVMTVEHVANLPAYPGGIAGYELGPVLQEAAEAAGAEFMLDAVEALEPGGGPEGRHLLRCAGGAIAARAVLIAAGSQRRRLQVPGEEALEGRGVSHCASCDGPLFRGESVCVVGGGDSAVGEAAVLAQHAGQVTLVFPGAAPHAQPYLRETLADLPNVALLPHARLQAILGDAAGGGVSGVRLADGKGEERELPVRGVFVYDGLTPATAFLHGVLALDASGRIETDDLLCSSIPGIYAAGDIRAGAACQLAAAADEGAAAARAAAAWLLGMAVAS